jgi:FtsZ-binding cell division protein ZapB
MSFLLIEQKYRILNNKIDILYNQLQSEISKLKEENNLLLAQMNNRLHNINDMNTINIDTITKTRHLIRQLEYENIYLKSENSTKDVIINNLRRQFYK